MKKNGTKKKNGNGGNGNLFIWAVKKDVNGVGKKPFYGKGCCFRIKEIKNC